MERRSPAVCKVSDHKEGKDEMTKASIDLQDLRRRIYVKAKAERSGVPGIVRPCAGTDGLRLGTEWFDQRRKPPGRIGPIILEAKQTGERSAGNPHAAFDEAGAGNVAWPRWCDTRRRKSEPTGNTNFGLNWRASPRPYRRAATGNGASVRIEAPAMCESCRRTATPRDLQPLRQSSTLLHRPRSCRRSIPRAWTAALYDRKSSVTNRSGTKAYFLKSLRISFNAACLFRLDWTSTSRTSPSASTARQR